MIVPESSAIGRLIKFGNQHRLGLGERREHCCQVTGVAVNLQTSKILQILTNTDILRHAKTSKVETNCPVYICKLDDR